MKARMLGESQDDNQVMMNVCNGRQVVGDGATLWTSGLSDCRMVALCFEDEDKQEHRLMMHSVSEIPDINNAEQARQYFSSQREVKPGDGRDPSGETFAIQLRNFLKEAAPGVKVAAVIYSSQGDDSLASDVSRLESWFKYYQNWLNGRSQREAKSAVSRFAIQAISLASSTVALLPKGEVIPASPQAFYAPSPSDFFQANCNSRSLSAVAIKALLHESLLKYQWAVSGQGNYSAAAEKILAISCEKRRYQRSNYELFERMSYWLDKIHPKMSVQDCHPIIQRIEEVVALAKPGQLKQFMRPVLDIMKKQVKQPLLHVQPLEKQGIHSFDMLRRDTLAMLTIRMKQLKAENKGMGAITGIKQKKIDQLTALQEQVAQATDVSSLGAILSDTKKKPLLSEGRTGQLVDQLIRYVSPTTAFKQKLSQEVSGGSPEQGSKQQYDL